MAIFIYIMPIYGYVKSPYKGKIPCVRHRLCRCPSSAPSPSSAQDIRSARLRRRITTTTMAERAFITRTTLRKVERGDPGVSLGIYATVMFVLGLTPRVADLADSRADEVGLQLEEERLPKRIRPVGRRAEETGMTDRSLLVYVDLEGAPHLVGRLWARSRKGKESATFEYDAAWLDNPSPLRAGTGADARQRPAPHGGGAVDLRCDRRLRAGSLGPRC